MFVIMINDLFVADTTLWKYVDDTTLVSNQYQRTRLATYSYA